MIHMEMMVRGFTVLNLSSMYHVTELLGWDESGQ
jgi:hypothetical protein